MFGKRGTSQEDCGVIAIWCRRGSKLDVQGLFGSLEQLTAPLVL